MKEIIQVAGVIDQAEAQMLINSGVDWLGFPLRILFHREDLKEETATEIIRSLVPPHAGVLITYLNKADDILELVNKTGVQKIQLHYEIKREELECLRRELPNLYIIKNLIIREENSGKLQNEIQTYSPIVDAFITDTYDSTTGAWGATGKTHDWNISRALVQISPRPLILAGGLKPENVYQAILKVKPAGIDAHTGLEGPDGRKDP
ncbi:MAG: phosphoribosylanthranilate isomerase, partial [Planctomycetota bacterium]